MINWGDVIQWIGIILVAIGLIYEVARNSKGDSQKDIQRWTRFEGTVDNINKKLDDPVDGLQAIRKTVEGIQVHCASVTSGCEERFKHIESDSKKR